MKKALLLISFLLFVPAMSWSQNVPDDIVGNWIAIQDGVESYAAITRSSDGTYRCQLYWVADSVDENGNKVLDTKNPDKQLRSVPIDQVVLFSGLKFNSKKNCWDGTKIYDPTRGIRANVTCTLINDGNTLRLRGSVLGIGETVEWTRRN